MLEGPKIADERVCRRQKRRSARVFPPFSSLQTDSSRCRHQFGQTNQIVGGCGENEEPVHQGATAVARLTHPANGLDPAEWLFDPLALDAARAIAGMPGR